MKFVVLSHHYNDERSWWAPYYGDQLGEAENMEAMIDRLTYDGLYKVFAVSDAATVQVETRKVTNRESRKIEL